ncbi:serine/threonine-protein kinase [Streptomyces bicolor]|uniref:serine/threonine-protein kinase n=1 Tax=Streptomyces bicolor TaxID=66874 RepID=UPI000690EA6C|nr:serine/threonine-protein kinase [Streptomyces bicolor]
MERLEQDDPRAVGPYRILARIATGGMAVVYLGRSRGGRAVAVKVPHAEYVREPGFRDRFRHEVAAATAAGGTYSPPVLDADPDAAAPWMATEFLPSVTLRDAVERHGPLPADSVRRLAAGLAEALAVIHRAGIVHLDVKPANVLLTADGPRLLDFGIAARTRSTGPAGSHGFMSPEQMAGDAGPPSDVYSLGATLEYARGPRSTDETLDEVIADCRRADPADRPTVPELTGRLATLASHPAPSGAAWLPPSVLAAIDRQQSAAANPPPPPTPVSPGWRTVLIAGAAVLAGAGGLGAVLTASGDDEPSPDPKDSGTPNNARPAASSTAPSPTPTPSPSPSPSAEPVTLEFVITGDGPLSDLTYWLNGRQSRPGSVSLPWRRTVEVRPERGTVDLQLRYNFPSGTTRVQVFRDGARATDQTFPSGESMKSLPDRYLYPCDVVMGGAYAVAGPLPDSDV